jgi:subtilase family serine protease
MVFPSLRVVVVFTLLMGVVVSSVQGAPQSRILETIDGSRITRLSGSLHPQARAEFDRGRVNGNTIIHGVSLIFSRSAAQQKVLQKLLAEQNDRASPNYHKWLTPEQFADGFGLTEIDVAKVTAWLESEGFKVVRIARNRTQVSFTGSVARIDSVFHTEIHNYLVNGQTHFANATELSIPQSLSEVVLGVRNLDDFRPKPRNTGVRRIPVESNFTSSLSGNHFLAPGDFAAIYGLKTLYDAGIDGSGEKIAVMGDSAIAISNIATFRSLSGLSANNPTQLLVPNSGTETVPSADEQTEAYLDLEWSGAIAKNASIIYVYVGNNPNYSVWDALQYAIDNKIAPVISTSFGFCEQGLGSANALVIQGWAQTANAQGQTIIAATGDSGAADCDTTTTQAARQGLAVDIPAAIPEVSGIGGSEFTGDSASTSTTTYWNGTNDGNNSSAISYIPEEVWNDTTASIQNGSGLAAGGGGASTFFSKPSWQTGTGVPADGHRDVPDVSLGASANHDPYLICSGTDGAGLQSCTNGFRDSQNHLDAVGGTSVGAPAFAGMVALLNQATNSSGQGNVNSTLYGLAGSAPSAFHDITTGDNKVPCATGSTNCPSGGSIGFSAGAGYDQASGLGSIDVYNLVTAWPGFSASPSYSLSANPTSVTVPSAGQSATSTITARATGGFGGAIALSCNTSSSTARISCSLSPASVSLDSATTNATSTLTIATAGSRARSSNSVSLNRGGGFGLAAGGGALLGCVALLGLPPRSRFRIVFPGLLLLALLAPDFGCGGGSASSATPAGTYTVTVTGSSGSVTHNVQVSLSVQ